MKKKISCAVLFLLTAALLLTGCKSAAPAVITYPASDVPTYTVDSAIPKDRPAPTVSNEYKDYLIPWYIDGAKTAQQNKTMEFYFMSDNDYPGLKGDDQYFGDSTVIFFPDGTTMLIDTGDTVYAPFLVQNLKYLGVETIDYLVFSHPHSDHSYAAFAVDGIFDSFKINNVCWNGALNASWSDPLRITHTAEQKGCNVIIWKNGDTLDIGDVHLEMLGPTFPVEGETYKGDASVNSTSLVMRFDYGETSALFTGDLYSANEQKLINERSDKLDVDLLKIPHHGRTTSSCKPFGKATSPQIAVAMGTTFVNDTTYTSYASQGTHVYLDSIDGYVHVISNGKFLSAIASHERTSTQFDKYDSLMK